MIIIYLLIGLLVSIVFRIKVVRERTSLWVWVLGIIGWPVILLITGIYFVERILVDLKV